MKKQHYVVGLILAVLMLAPLVARAQIPPMNPVTRLTLTGPPGEYISQGQTHIYTPEDGNFQLYHGPNANNGVQLWFYTPGRVHEWYVWFGGPDRTSPQVGQYTNAARFVSAGPGQSRLSIFGDGRGCNESLGSFEVKQIAYGTEGAVVQLWVTFTQYCDNQIQPLTGELIFQMDASTPTRSTTWGKLKTMYR